MGRGKHITPSQREEILCLRNEKMTLSEISRRLKLSINAVHQALKHINSNKSVNNKTRPARPRKTTPRLDRTIYRISEADRFRTAVDIHRDISARFDTQISIHTVRRRLTEFGLKGRIARKKPFISKKNHKARLAFAKKHLCWSAEQWSKVIFTDESKFNCFGSDGRKYVRRKTGEEFNPKCIQSTINPLRSEGAARAPRRFAPQVGCRLSGDNRCLC
ncbi:Transposable element Tc1 transposase [Anthophora quadrimaculata]